MKATREVLRQLLFFTSILAGFSFSAAVQLVSLNQKRKITSWVVGCLTIAALMMLTVTFLESFLLIKLENFPTIEEIPPQLLSVMREVGLFAFFLLLMGLIVFMTGVGLVGWLQSKAVGIVSSIAVTAAIFVMFYALVVLFLA